MDLSTFIVAVFCLIDDGHQHTRVEALSGPSSVIP
jgi:hypothetical protein